MNLKEYSENAYWWHIKEVYKMLFSQCWDLFKSVSYFGWFLLVHIVLIIISPIFVSIKAHLNLIDAKVIYLESLKGKK